MEDTIDYCGVIERMDGPNAYVKVALQSACSGCQARAMCATAGGKEQIIEVAVDPETFDVNEPVILSGHSSMGHQAVILAFVIPLAIVVAFISVTTYLQWEESISALAGLSLLIPYYIVLYLLRNSLKKKFSFTIKKINL
jgi:sigma-E factor negative regulatory protein RseC